MALDLCVSSAPQGVYTLMGPELDEEGWVKDPIRMDWATGACVRASARGVVPFFFYFVCACVCG